jgi:COP9 signalosome complex subunit 4
MESRLAQISSLGQKDKGPAYVAAVNEVFASPNPSTIAADLRTILDTVLQDNVVVGRQVLLELARTLGEKSILDAELRKQIVQDALSIVQPRLVSYEEQVSNHIYILANQSHLSQGQCPSIHPC